MDPKLDNIHTSATWHLRAWSDPMLVNDPPVLLTLLLAGAACLPDWGPVEGFLRWTAGGVLAWIVVTRLVDMLRLRARQPAEASGQLGTRQRLACRGQRAEIQRLLRRASAGSVNPRRYRQLLRSDGITALLLINIAVLPAMSFVLIGKYGGLPLAAAGALGVLVVQSLLGTTTFLVRPGELNIQARGTSGAFGVGAGTATTRSIPLTHASIACDFARALLIIEAEGERHMIDLSTIPFAHRFCADVLAAAQVAGDDASESQRH